MPPVHVVVAGMPVFRAALVWANRAVAGSVDVEGATGVGDQGK